MVVPRLLRPASQLVVAVHLAGRGPGPGLGSSLLVTVSLMRGDNSLHTATRDLRPGTTQDIALPVPAHLGRYGPIYILTSSSVTSQACPRTTATASW